MEMKFIELFAGIGGFRYGLKKANDTITERTQQRIRQGSRSNNTIVKPFVGKKQFTCVYANEWDKYACQIYRKNFGDKELHEEDIREITTESIPDHDFLTGGFPCPTYSIAGKRKGFNDPRGIVYFEICRIAKVKKPALLLLENVKGLLNHDNGNTFRIILDSLSELGYDCEWEVLNSKNFGVPQNRERVFIVGHLRGKSRQKIFPIGKTIRENNESGEGETSGCIKSGEGNIQNDNTYLIYEGAIISKQNKKWLEDGKKLSRNFPQGQRVYSDRGIASTIAGNAGGLGGKTGLYQMHNLHHHRTGKYGNGIKQMDESSFTLDSGSGRDLVIANKTSVRRLTPTECERLQGFPDGWTDGISDTQRYKCLGNAVTTNVITEIGKKILKEIT